LNKKVTDHAIVREELYGTTPEPTYGGALSFMRRKYTTDMSGVDVAVTGIPLDTATTNRPGARFGPRAIRAASSIMAWEKPYGMEFDPFDKLAVVDAGDCFFDHGRPENTPDEIEAHAFGIIDQGPALLSLGGDHFVSYPLLRAHQRKHGGALSSSIRPIRYRSESARRIRIRWASTSSMRPTCTHRASKPSSQERARSSGTGRST
jgi:agmatinase